MPRSEPTAEFFSACDALALEISGAELDALGDYLHRMLETNRKFNLTAVRDPDHAWMRHILDSLSLIPFLHGVGTLIDVGSGAGLPGVPLAIARPEMSVTILESTGKKARFVRETAEAMGLHNVSVVNDRAETAGRDIHHRERYDAAVARAIGPMNVLLELTLPLVRVGGRVLAMKGRQAEAELQNVGDALMTLGGGEVAVYETLPGIEPDAVAVEILKANPTPRTYPRRPGIPKQDPL